MSQKNLYNNLSILILKFASLFLALLLIIGVFSYQILAHAQTDQPTLQIDSQAEQVQIKQLSKSELGEEKTRLENKLSDLEKEINITQENLDKTQNTISNLEDRLVGLRKNQETASNTREEAVNNLIKENNSENQESQENLLTKNEIQIQIDEVAVRVTDEKKKEADLEIELSEKQAELKSTKEAVSRIEEQLQEKNTEVNDEVTQLRSQLLSISWRVLFYAALIGVYWLVHQILYRRLKKQEMHDTLKRILSISITFVAMVATGITLALAFLGNFSFLLTSIGVMSAALVVALQDFVSSFFAWLMIRTKNQFNEGDIISLSNSKGVITGTVEEIGLFRSSIREKIGGDGPDSERFTGSLSYFPNNMILKEIVSNFNEGNKMRWHQIDILIRYEDNYKLARQVLEEAVNAHFEHTLANRDRYLERSKYTSLRYKPKIYMALDESGTKFTIWFGARIENYRYVLQDLSMRVIDGFASHDIKFSYPSRRIVY